MLSVWRVQLQVHCGVHDPGTWVGNERPYAVQYSGRAPSGGWAEALWESCLWHIDSKHNWNVFRSRNVVNPSVKQSMWHKITITQSFLSPELRRPPFREYHIPNLYARFRPKLKRRFIRIYCSCMRFPSECKQCWLVKYVLGHCPKWRTT